MTLNELIRFCLDHEISSDVELLGADSEYGAYVINEIELHAPGEIELYADGKRNYPHGALELLA